VPSSPATGRATRDKSDFLRCKDAQGRYADFHANRHPFITNLGRVGIHPKTAQTPARHSDIRLTMNVYSHTDLAEKTEAVRRLPGLWECSGSARESQDGTNGQKTSLAAVGATKTAEPDDSAEVLVASVVDANRRQNTAADTSAPGGTRTPNPRFRRPMLCPIELRAHVFSFCQCFSGYFGSLRVTFGTAMPPTTLTRAHARTPTRAEASAEEDHG